MNSVSFAHSAAAGVTMSLTFFAYPYGVHVPPHLDGFPSVLDLRGYPQRPKKQPRTPKIDILELWGQALAQNLDF